jgi:proteasome lid subunit RPN8/RPN11
MSNMTPFEIRLELLKMAKEMLTEEYYGKREVVSNDWQVKVDSAKVNGGAVPEHPGFPAYPSETDIILKAQTLNGFVSNVTNIPQNTQDKTTTKKST